MQSWTLDAFKCAGFTVFQAKKVFPGNRVFQCRCTKARPAKVLQDGRERL